MRTHVIAAHHAVPRIAAAAATCWFDRWISDHGLRGRSFWAALCNDWSLLQSH